MKYVISAVLLLVLSGCMGLQDGTGRGGGERRGGGSSHQH